MLKIKEVNGSFENHKMSSSNFALSNFITGSPLQSRKTVPLYTSERARNGTGWIDYVLG
jgi:hypothetical protein